MSPKIGSHCMCDFRGTCAGTGYLGCAGCGGDLCVCAECFGQGETECPGCAECPLDDELDWTGTYDEVSDAT